MASELGQIIYNLQAYDTVGGLVSTKYTTTIDGTISSTEEGYETYRINIFDSSKDLVAKAEAQRFTKLGIQAPPGTRFVINGTSKVIMIGRTGVYELDEDLTVSSLYFIRNKKYVLDETASKEALTTGISGMKKAENDRKARLTGGLYEYGTKSTEGKTTYDVPDNAVYNINTNKIYVNGEEWFPDGGYVDETIYKLNDYGYQYFVGLGTFNDDYPWAKYREIQTEYESAYTTALNKYIQGVNGIYTWDETSYQEVYNVIIDYIKE